MSRADFKPGNMLYPVPAVMVSCQREGEKPNIITVAWAGTVCSDPAMVSISVRPERYSHAIIEETGEFVINLTTKDIVRATDYCGVRSGRDVDKYKEMHLTPSQSKVVKAPGIQESPVNIECKVKEVCHLGTHDMFIAEVVAVTVDDKYMNESGRFELNSSGLVAYSHGEYFELGRKLGTFGFSVKKQTKREHERSLKNKSDKKPAKSLKKQSNKRTEKSMKAKSDKRPKKTLKEKSDRKSEKSIKVKSNKKPKNY